MPYDLTVQTRAVQILIDKGKASGVKVMTPDKKTFIIRSKNIILSASTLETPRLLLNSGIKGRAIGHYLIDHSSLRATGTLSGKGFPEPQGPLGILIPSTEAYPYQFQVFREDLRTIIHSYGTVESRYENKVFLDPYRKDEYGIPEIQIHYSYSQRDLDVIMRMTEAMKQLLLVTGLTTEGGISTYLRPPGDDNHKSGTCRMGDDPATSAVNRYGQIHGIFGLYVADNSVLPSIGTNPTLTTVALAIRTADHIINQLK
jgi:choline dehydrogenase-like flavoprotein